MEYLFVIKCWWSSFESALNDHNGLLTLIAIVMSIVAMFLTIRYRRNDKKARLQAVNDELSLRREYRSYCLSHEEKEICIHERMLEKELKRK